MLSNRSAADLIEPDGKDHEPDAHVFGNDVGELRKDFANQWDRVCTSAKITDLNFHDLRREFASRLLESGVVPLHETSEWLGHADIQTTSIYLRTKRASLMQAVERLERVAGRAPVASKRSKSRAPSLQKERGGTSLTVN